MERENKPQKVRKMGLNCSYLFAPKTIMEDKNKAAASALCAKGGKRLQRKPQIGGVQWDRGTRTLRGTNHTVTIHGVRATKYGIKKQSNHIVGSNWGLDVILDLVITSLVFRTRGFNNSQCHVWGA